MAGKLGSTRQKIIEFILPTKKTRSEGTSVTNTYKSGNAETLASPSYRDHLEDLYSTRQSQNSNELLKNLFITDPDCSAAVNAYLTTSNTEIISVAKDAEGNYSQEGTKILYNVMNLIFRRNDYTLNYQMKPSLQELRNELKYMLLLRGGIGAEMVFDKLLRPSEIRVVDMLYIKWKEQKNGQYKPTQETTESGEKIDLDIPSFFTSFYHRDPTTPYTYSVFVSAINIIAARQQIINDLYRIMKITGYPRIDIELAEEVIMKNVPASIKTDPQKTREYIQTTLQTVVNKFNSISADQPFGHTDSIKAKILNDKQSGMTLQISEIIDTLNAQNQAALKSVSSFLGRGQSGINTATVEAQVFAKHVDELNTTIDHILSETLTLACRMQGWDGLIEIKSQPVHLKPDLELEAMRALKQARLKSDLSLGIITDEEYHIQMYGRIPLGAYEKLSGTNFDTKEIDTSDVSSNDDPLGRALTPENNKSAQGNAIKKKNNNSN